MADDAALDSDVAALDSDMAAAFFDDNASAVCASIAVCLGESE
jgi:hypothetical protein